MAKPDTGSESKLRLRRTFAAPREEVYRAWTDREALEKWMCQDVPSHRVKYLELDVRPGGSYAIEVTDSATGERFIGRGSFHEVAPPEKLVFTWGWTRKQGGQETPLHEETQVTVEFFARGRSPECVLTHENFRTAKERAETETGWNGCFDALALVVEKS